MKNFPVVATGKPTDWRETEKLKALQPGEEVFRCVLLSGRAFWQKERIKRNRQPDCLLSVPVFWLSDRSIPNGAAIPSLKERHDQNRDASENLTRERPPVVSQVVEKQLFSVFPEMGRFVFTTTCHCSGAATAALRRSGKAGFRGGRTPVQSGRNRFFQAVAYRRDKKIVLFNRGRPRVGQAAVPSVGYDEGGLGNTCADRQGTRCRRLRTGRKGKNGRDCAARVFSRTVPSRPLRLPEQAPVFLA